MFLLCDIHKEKYRVLDTSDMVLEVFSKEDFTKALLYGIKLDNVDTEMFLDHPDCKVTFRPYTSKMSYNGIRTCSMVTGTGLLLLHTFMYTNREKDYAIRYIPHSNSGYELYLFTKGIYYHVEYNPQKRLLLVNDVALELTADIRYFGYMPENECIILAVSQASVLRFYKDKVELTYNHSSFGYILSNNNIDLYKMSMSQFEQYALQ